MYSARYTVDNVPTPCVGVRAPTRGLLACCANFGIFDERRRAAGYSESPRWVKFQFGIALHDPATSFSFNFFKLDTVNFYAYQTRRI